MDKSPTCPRQSLLISCKDSLHLVTDQCCDDLGSASAWSFDQRTFWKAENCSNIYSGSDLRFFSCPNLYVPVVGRTSNLGLEYSFSVLDIIETPPALKLLGRESPPHSSWSWFWHAGYGELSRNLSRIFLVGELGMSLESPRKESTIVSDDSLINSAKVYRLAGLIMTGSSWSQSLNSSFARTCLGLTGIRSSVSVPLSSKLDIMLDLLHSLLL